MKIEIFEGNKDDYEESMKPLTKEQLTLLFDNTKDKRRRAILALGSMTGLGLDEVIRLKPENIDYQKGIINIWTPKKIRKAKVSSKVLNILKEFENSGFDIDYSEGYLKNQIPVIIKEAIGVRKTWTALRRTFVMMCRDNYVPIEIPIENTGTSFEIVFDIYRNNGIRDYKMPELI